MLVAQQWEPAWDFYNNILEKGQTLFSFQMMFGRNMTEFLLNPTQEYIGHLFFCEVTQYNSDTHNVRTLTPMNASTQILPYEHFWRLNRQIFEINEVTTDALLSTGTSTTIESTMTLNPRKLAPTVSRTYDLRCYWDSYNH